MPLEVYSFMFVFINTYIYLCLPSIHSCEYVNVNIYPYRHAWSWYHSCTSHAHWLERTNNHIQYMYTPPVYVYLFCVCVCVCVCVCYASFPCFYSLVFVVNTFFDSLSLSHTHSLSLYLSIYLYLARSLRSTELLWGY